MHIFNKNQLNVVNTRVQQNPLAIFEFQNVKDNFYKIENVLDPIIIIGNYLCVINALYGFGAGVAPSTISVVG